MRKFLEDMAECQVYSSFIIEVTKKTELIMRPQEVYYEDGYQQEHAKAGISLNDILVLCSSWLIPPPKKKNLLF